MRAALAERRVVCLVDEMLGFERVLAAKNPWKTGDHWGFFEMEGYPQITYLKIGFSLIIPLNGISFKKTSSYGGTSRPWTWMSQKIPPLLVNVDSRALKAGWWFGTCFIFPFSWECHHPNWRSHIFQRGRSTTNQKGECWLMLVVNIP